MTYLEFIKDRLRVTWSYQDKEIEEMIENAKARLKSIASVEFSLENPTDTQRMANEILADLCRYQWNGCQNQFMTDYRQELMNLQLAIAMVKE